MAGASKRLAVGSVCALLAVFVAAGAAAQTQVYRYTDKDGRTIYSDKPPPADATSVQAKRLGPNFIENSQIPYAAQQAQERFPVTLYTFSCGEVCQNAEGLLNRRGVPFTTVNVEDPKGAEQLKTLTGELNAPVLQVGDKLVAKGFNEARWQAMLDDAGYPKTPAPRRITANRPAAEPAVAKPGTTQSAPVPGASGYPKE
jgi:glutaredoxin